MEFPTNYALQELHFVLQTEEDYQLKSKYALHKSWINVTCAWFTGFFNVDLWRNSNSKRLPVLSVSLISRICWANIWNKVTFPHGLKNFRVLCSRSVHFCCVLAIQIVRNRQQNCSNSTGGLRSFRDTFLRILWPPPLPHTPTFTDGTSVEIFCLVCSHVRLSVRLSHIISAHVCLADAFCYIQDSEFIFIERVSIADKFQATSEVLTLWPWPWPFDPIRVEPVHGFPEK